MIKRLGLCLLALVLAASAEAEECGLSGTAAMAPFFGSWRSPEGDEIVFGKGSFSFEHPNPTAEKSEATPMHLVPEGQVLEPADMHFDCQTLDAAEIEHMMTALDEYIGPYADDPAYDEQRDAIADLRARLRHPPYKALTADQYESTERFILASDGELLAVWTGDASLTLQRYRKVLARH